MPAQTPTPILIDSRILTRIIEDTLEIAGVSRETKNTCLNAAGARLADPKANWGRITSAKSPILSQNLPNDTIEAMAEHLSQWKKPRAEYAPFSDAIIEAAAGREALAARSLGASINDRTDVADILLTSPAPIYALSGNYDKVLTQLDEAAYARGDEIEYPSFAPIRFEIQEEIDDILPHDCAITVYTDTLKAGDETLRRLFRDILHRINLAPTAPFRVIFVTDDAARLKTRFHRVSPDFRDRTMFLDIP